MNCLKPVKIVLTDEERQKRFSKVNAPLEYRLATSIFVPCGKCEACMSKRKSDWMFRLNEEYKHCESAIFITLTYADECLPRNKHGIPCVKKKDVQLFLKRLRKRIYPYKIRYFFISEYGPLTSRPHYHGIIFDFPKLLFNKLDDIILFSWNMGFITVAPVNSARIAYVSSYCLGNTQNSSYPRKNFLLCSRKPGIGFNFCNQSSVASNCIARGSSMWRVASSDGSSYNVRLPRYYRDKLFNDEFKCEESFKCSEYISKKFKELLSKQSRFLIKHGYDLNYQTLHSAIPGSPYSSYLDEKEDFRDRVRNKSKDKKVK